MSRDRGLAVDSLRDVHERTLAPLVGASPRVALLDFPNHGNVGDAAIWLGETIWLRRIGAEVAYVCDKDSYRPEDLRERLGEDGVILLHGGGNLGDLWPEYQAFRERVLAEFREHAVVQLPQTIHFSSPTNAARAAEAFAAHGRFTLLVRDHMSARLADEFFSACPRGLCPDSAFHLEAPPPATEPDCAVLYLRRLDKEQSHPESDSGADAEVCDWVSEAPWHGDWQERLRRAHADMLAGSDPL